MCILQVGDQQQTTRSTCTNTANFYQELDCYKEFLCKVSITLGKLRIVQRLGIPVRTVALHLNANVHPIWALCFVVANTANTSGWQLHTLNKKICLGTKLTGKVFSSNDSNSETSIYIYI